MNSTGSCSLIIRGREELDFVEITRNLKIQPTSVSRKGEIRSKLIDPVPNDIWTYEIKLREDDQLDVVLGRLLSILKPVKNYIWKLCCSQNVCIRCYIQSDFAQIFFLLSPSVIKDLAELNLSVEMSILSWGGVEDNG